MASTNSLFESKRTKETSQIREGDVGVGVTLQDRLQHSLPARHRTRKSRYAKTNHRIKKGQRVDLAGLCEFNPGSDLRSHTVTRAVSSALRGLTSVFGMGTGVAPAV